MNTLPEVKVDLAPFITHLDITTPIPVVSKESTEFCEITGVLVLLDNSLNTQEPIVCSPDEALQTSNKLRVDVLVIGPFIKERSDLRNERCVEKTKK